jgi:hypothetical protein
MLRRCSGPGLLSRRRNEVLSVVVEGHGGALVERGSKGLAAQRRAGSGGDAVHIAAFGSR